VIVLMTLFVVLLAACAGAATDSETTTTAGETTTSAAAPEETTTTTSPAAPMEDLVVYSGRNENFVAPVVEAFTAATGIQVRVRYGDGTSDLAATLLNEGETTDADVFWAQDPAWIGAIADQGLLTELPDDLLGLVSEEYRDADGQWVGVTARSRVLVYNPELVSEDELPQSVSELTEPQWNGRFGIAPSNASFVAFVSAMMLSDGEEATLAWLEGIRDNDVQTFSGNGGIVQAVIAGDLDAGLVNHYYLLQSIADQGEVSGVNHYLAPGDTGALVMATGAGVLAPSDNQEAAQEFIRFLLSAEAQEHFSLNLHEYALIEGVEAPGGLTPLGELAGPDINLSDLADYLESSVDLIAQAGLS
jgi:iron(III) transport system substrate-binding protein